MFAFPTSPLLGGGGAGADGGGTGFSGRDVIWVDLRFPGGVGNNGTDELPYNTANIGLGALPDGGTLVFAGGDASTEPGVSVAGRSFTVRGFSGQTAAGGLAPVLPTLTYAITTGTQRLAFRNVSVSLVHAGTAASLTQFYFEFCPSVTLTAGGDASPVAWVGAPGNTFSGSGGAAQLIGGTIAGYTANSAGTIVASGCNVTGDLVSTSSVTLVGACTFGGPVSITAPNIFIDLASYAAAVTAGVTFSTAVHPLVAFGTPVDTGTANAPGSSPLVAHVDHVHNTPFSAVNAALAAANAAVSFNSQRITNVANPVNPGDGINKAYADGIAVGLKLKDPAVAVATANQATMTGQAQTVDGVALNTVGMRVLLQAQTTATQNGLWVIQSGAWTRPTDFAAASSAALSYVPVTGGTVYAGSGWLCTTTTGSDVVGTNNLVFQLFTQPATTVAGAGLTKTGNTIDVVADADGSIVVLSDSIKVGVLATDAQHGNRGGGGIHAAVTTSVNGFMSAADKLKLDGITGTGVELVGKQPCRAATTANITLSGTQTVDGVALIATDRCLVKNQTTGSQNGIYVVAAGAWARSTDANTTGQLLGGQLFPISEGTANGNRVAVLTTDDPITIGTTALTFAMDRVVPVASVAPADVTKSAAAIGTATDAARADHKHDVSTAAPVAGGVTAGGTATEGTATSVARSDHLHAVSVATPVDIGTANAAGSAATFVRSDHVHNLTAAVAIAALALAATSISVNSQKITNLATPTLSTDAVNKAYVDGATFITAGAGLTRTGATIDVVANADGTIIANANDIQVGTLIAGNYAVNTIALTKLANASATGHFVMRTTAGAGAWEDGTAANARSALGITVGASGTFSYSNGTSLGNTTTYTTDGVGLIGLSYASFGTTPAAGGLVRGPNNSSPSVVARGAGAYDVIMVGNVDGSDIVRFGDPTRAAGAYWDTKAAGFYGFWIGGTQYLGVTNAGIQIVGTASFPNNVAMITAKTTGGTSFGFLSYLSDNASRIGDDTNTAAHYVKVKTGGFVNIQVNNVDEYVFNGATADFKDNFLLFGTNPAGSGTVRFANNLGLNFRNAANTADIVGLTVASDNAVYVGDATNTTVVYLRAGTIVLRPGGSDEYSFNNVIADFKDNQLRFGTNPSTNGLANFPTNVVMLAQRNNTNTGNLSLFYSDVSDNLVVGDFNGTAGLYLDVKTGGTLNLRVNSTAEYVFDSTHADFKDNYVQFGTNPAAGGTIRLANNTVVRWRNAANSADISLGTNSSDALLVGDSTGCAGVTLNAKTGSTHTVLVNGTTEYSFSATIADFKDNALQFGTNPATTGTLRVPFDTSIIVARNVANTADLNVIKTDAANTAIFIGQTTNLNITYDAASLHNIRIGGSPKLQIGSSISALASLDMGTGNSISMGSYLEIFNMTAPAAPGALGWRIYCDNATGNLMAKPSSGSSTKTLATF